IENEMSTKLASKMGITSARVLRQADEYVRLSLVKCTGLGITTGTSKAVICLELVATSMKFPLDKVRFFFLNMTSNYPGVGDLTVQFGCMDAIKVATQNGENLKSNVDLSKPLFTTAALNAACECLKIKVDRKLLASSGAKKGIFDRLCTQFQKLGQDICSKPTSQKQQKEDSEECATQDYEEWKPKNLWKMHLKPIHKS
uniref:Origin recognition complex subunit 6 n=1 Tax=Oncorhynchus mykiss TaxID=8022 RepID=A0A8C7NFE5_ONCMY